MLCAELAVQQLYSAAQYLQYESCDARLLSLVITLRKLCARLLHKPDEVRMIM